MELQEENEITVAVEALRDLQNQNEEGLDPQNADGNVSRTEKIFETLASVSGHVETVYLGATPQIITQDTVATREDLGATPQIINQDTGTTREVSGQAGAEDRLSSGAEDRGKTRKRVTKDPLQNASTTLKGITLPSNLRTVSLAFPLRDSQRKRILLPKPTASSNVVSIPLSSIISQTIGMPHVVHSKSRDVSVSATDVSGSGQEKKTRRENKREGSFTCSRCSTKTTTRQALWKHKRRFHSTEPQEGKVAERVSCDECNTFCCKTLKELLVHYNKVHSKKLRVFCKEFPSERDFEEWKKQTEKMCGSWFVLSNGKKVYEHHTTRYYYCNKSGFSKGKGIRTSKRAAKIEGKCCAYMRKKQDRDTGQVTVEYSLDHVGHVTKLGLSLLPANMSDTITKWHSTKAGVDSFISEIYVKATGLDSLTVTLPDSLARLKQSHIPKDQLESDGLTRMVTELRSRKDNPVLIYKPQGDVEHEMSSEDFVIGIQTQFQREMLKKHADKMICAHVSENDDSFLLTLLVIDKESEEVIPVSWLLGSVQESRLFKPFLESLKVKCGDLETDLFVTNLTSALYHTWTDTFSKPWRKLDCSWHVDEDWRTNLQLYISDTENQLVVYAYLKTLQYEDDEIHFRKILQEFMTFLGEVSSGFKCFFSDNYLLGERCSHWALCFRKGLPSHRNNLDGALYDAIKDVILQTVHYSKTVDLMLALLKLSRDITVIHSARYTKKGKGTQTAREMKSHHTRSATLHCDYFTIGDGEWSVSSASDPSVHYVLRRVLGDCHCKLRCEVCGVCVHMYLCSCIEFLLGSSGCEHVHMIHMTNEANKTPVGSSSPVVEVEECAEGASLPNELQEEDQGSTVKYLRKEALRKLKDLEKSLKNISDEGILRNICSHINVAMDTAGEIQVPEDNVVNMDPNLLT